MSPILWFYDENHVDQERIGYEVEGPIPPVGARVSVPGDAEVWRVLALHVMYPDRVAKVSRPIVQVMCERSRGLFR